MVGILVGGRIKYVAKPGARGEGQGVREATAKKGQRRSSSHAPLAPDPSPLATPKAKQRIDPQYLAAAREFRDRYLERVNGSPEALSAPMAKYDVSRSLPARSGAEVTNPSHACARIERATARQPRRQLPSAA